MLVTFNRPKNARNIADRGIPFRLALRIEWGTALLGEDIRKGYGEKRFQALGFIGDRLHMLVFTPGPPALHVISLQWANDRERMTLHCPFGGLYGASVQLGLSDAGHAGALPFAGVASDKRYSLGLIETSVVIQPIEFNTARLAFRLWQDRHRVPFVEMNADPAVMRHFPATLAADQTNAGIDLWLDQFQERGWSNWAVERAVSGEFVGFIGLSVPRRQLPFGPCVEIGCRLKHAAWGHGLATEGAAECLRVGFTQLGLGEIVSFTTLANLPSISVMERSACTSPTLTSSIQLFRRVIRKGFTASTNCCNRNGRAFSQTIDALRYQQLAFTVVPASRHEFFRI